MNKLLIIIPIFLSLLSCKPSHQVQSSGTVPVVNSKLVTNFIEFTRKDHTAGVILWRSAPGCPVGLGQKNELMSIAGRRVNTRNLFDITFVDENFNLINGQKIGLNFSKSRLTEIAVTNEIPIVKLR